MPDPKLHSAVIFDMDGLLLNTERPAMQAWQRAAADIDYVLSDQLYKQVVGRPVTDTYRIFREHLGEEFPSEKVRERKQLYLAEIRAEGGIQPMPGAEELLKDLQAKQVPICVATSTETEAARQHLSDGGLMQYIPQLVGGEQVSSGKPAPDIFLHAAAVLQKEAADCLVFEDSEMGVRAAARAGMTVIMVPDLIIPSQEIEELVYCVSASLAEVHKYLPQLLAF